MTTLYVIEKQDIEGRCPENIYSQLPEGWKFSVGYSDCYTFNDALDTFCGIMEEEGWNTIFDY